MTTKPVVCVLEDMSIRVAWLEENFPDVDIRHSTDVTSFMDTLNKVDKDNLKLLIMDHDLGLGDPTTENTLADREGKDGRYAVDQMEYMPVPVLVWSMNFVHGPTMYKDLLAKGFNAVHVPFMESLFPTLKRVIQNALT